MTAAAPWSGLLLQFLHAAVLLAAAPLTAGLTRWVRARLDGRRGASPAQPYRDLARGLRRAPVLAPGASPLAAVAPLVAVGALALAVGLLPPVLLPGLGGPTLLGPAPAALPIGPAAPAPAPVSGDLVLIAALLGLSRFALALALADAGTAAGGLGASRLAARPALFDPALLLVALCVAALAGAAAASGGADAAPDGAVALGARAPLLLAAAAVLFVAASDTPGPPFMAPDGGAMPHDLGSAPEAAGADFSGWHLALWEYARALRRALFIALFLALLPLPPAAAAGAVLGPLLGLAGFGLACVAVAAVESRLAAMHPDRVPALGVGALVLAAVAAALLLIGGVAA